VNAEDGVEFTFFFFFYYLEKVVLGREWLVVVSSVFLMQFKMLNEERRSQLKD